MSTTGVPHLEVFSGNGLYSSREVPTLRKYKTVKEVCALTGLTGKHLYYFHHEKVVCASAYANYSVAGNDGYKLYDDAAVEKLRQIALYYRLGLKRNEIRDINTEKRILERVIQTIDSLGLNGSDAIIEAILNDFATKYGNCRS